MTAVRMPPGLSWWIAAMFGGELGAGILAFALTWTASGFGPHAASAVLLMTVAPAALLGLVGGAAADRHGPRALMIATTSAMATVSALFAIIVATRAAQPVLLFVFAALVGLVSAFFRPAAGVFPRLFVGDAELGTAMARVGVAAQIARTVGAPLGGMLVGLLSLGGVAALDAAGSLGMLIVLLLVRPPLAPAAPDGPDRSAGIADGVSTARRTPGIPALLTCVAIVAGAVIPAVLLGIPLIARERGWTASEAGLIEAGWIAGGIVAGAWFSWRGTAAHAWRPMAAGPAIVACGLVVLALAASWPAAAAGTITVGVGVVIFTAHVFPTYLLLAPPAMMSRFQSLLIVVQQAPQLAIYPLVGVIAAAVGAGPMIAASGVVAVVASVVVLRSPTLRSFTTAGQNSP
ncbi:MAG: MFS transporter [Microbacterium sp.]|jgi:MFS family permease|nr:MFS transporter [Microbacterium sp.]